MVLLLLGLLLLASRFAFMMPWLIEHWLALAFSCHACVKLSGHVPVYLKEVPKTWRTQRQHKVLSQPRILLDLSTTNTTRAAALQVLLLLHLLVCLLLLWSIYLLTPALEIHSTKNTTTGTTTSTTTDQYYQYWMPPLLLRYCQLSLFLLLLPVMLTTFYMPSATYYSLLTAHYSLLTISYLLLHTWRLLLITDWMLCPTRYIWFNAHHYFSLDHQGLISCFSLSIACHLTLSTYHSPSGCYYKSYPILLITVFVATTIRAITITGTDTTWLLGTVWF